MVGLIIFIIILISFVFYTKRLESKDARKKARIAAIKAKAEKSKNVS